MPKVSIVMPSLNVAAYVRECMESVIRQTLKDIEILCVDAGSTDGTWEILRKYADKDKRIKLIRSEKKSYGHQMNLGIREATGSYIGIVETDDYILPKMYERLYTYALDNDADFVKSDYYAFTTLDNNQKLLLKCSHKRQYDTPLTKDTYTYSTRLVEPFIWNGIYKRKFLLDHQIWFQETPGAAFQDIGFRYQVALSAERGFFIKDAFYCYRRDNMGSSTYNSKSVLFNYWECKNLLEIAEGQRWTNGARTSFLAREIVRMAYGPYLELLTWGRPACETEQALEWFQDTVKECIEKGTLGPLTATSEDWTMAKMLAENLDFFKYYLQLKADVLIESTSNFLRGMSKKDNLILFGSGEVGACAYCTIRNSGLQNVAAFCDNDKRKWGSDYLGRPVISPEEAVKRYANAYFIITNYGYRDEIQNQLFALHVPAENITVYRLPAAPMFSTNVSLKHLI